MNVIAINGGPRKDWSTATMLKSAIEGAESVGAQTELFHLYDLDFKGCTSCFSCKRKGNNCDGLCAQRDDLRPVLERVLTCDVLLVASPIYFGDVTGETRSFIERLLFPSASYDQFGLSTYPGRTSCGLVLTMNCPEQFMKTVHYDVLIETHLQILGILKGKTEAVVANETWQFKDYSAMNAAMFDVEAKAKRRDEVFPVDRQNAFDMGARLAQG